MTQALRVVVALVVCSGCGPTFRLAPTQDRLWNAISDHRHAEAVELARTNVELHTQAYGHADDRTFTATRRLAEVVADTDDMEEAFRILTTALKNESRFYGERNFRLSAGVSDLAMLHAGTGEYAEARRLLDRSRQLCDGRDDADQFGCGRRRDYLRSIHYRTIGEYDRAEQFLVADTSDAAAEGNLTDSHLASIGDLHFEHGDYGQGRRYYEASRRFWESMHRPTDGIEKVLYRSESGDVEIITGAFPHNFDTVAPRCLENLITLHERIGDSAEATRLRAAEIQLWRDAPDAEKEILERIAAEERGWRALPKLSYGWQTLGFYHMKKNNQARAIHAYEKGASYADEEWALQSEYERHFPNELLLDSHLMLGDLYVQAGRFPEAEQQYRKILDVASRYLNPRHRWHLDARSRLAVMHEAAGNREEAERAWRDYADAAAQRRGRSHADYAWGLARLSRAKHALGDTGGGRRLQQQAQQIWRDYARNVEAAANRPLPGALKTHGSLSR